MVVAGSAVSPAATPAHAAKRTFGSRALEQGMRGRDVRVLQDFLTRWGVRTEVDGIYGRLTARRVRTWERSTERRVDGDMSRRDARELRRAVAAGETREGSAGAQTRATAPGEKATLLPDGTAVAPASAPPAVQAMIEAGNRIHDKPYKYGGGHGRFEDSGYDCSGSMSYVLHAAGLLDQALDSSGFMRYGDPGRGSWATLYAHGSHSFMVIAGLRFDTSGRREDNSRWHADMRSSSGYAVRHPAGL
jgi:cell wall-associated NlpC family hydrolase